MIEYCWQVKIGIDKGQTFVLIEGWGVTCNSAFSLVGQSPHTNSDTQVCSCTFYWPTKVPTLVVTFNYFVNKPVLSASIIALIWKVKQPLCCCQLYLTCYKAVRIKNYSKAPIKVAQMKNTMINITWTLTERVTTKIILSLSAKINRKS